MDRQSGPAPIRIPTFCYSGPFRAHGLPAPFLLTEKHAGSDRVSTPSTFHQDGHSRCPEQGRGGAATRNLHLSGTLVSVRPLSFLPLLSCPRPSWTLPSQDGGKATLRGPELLCWACGVPRRKPLQRHRRLPPRTRAIPHARSKHMCESWSEIKGKELERDGKGRRELGVRLSSQAPGQGGPKHLTLELNAHSVGSEHSTAQVPRHFPWPWWPGGHRKSSLLGGEGENFGERWQGRVRDAWC